MQSKAHHGDFFISRCSHGLHFVLIIMYPFKLGASSQNAAKFDNETIKLILGDCSNK